MASSLDSALAADLAALDRAGLRRILRPVSQRHGAHVTLNGTDAIDFSSNDYLGLASDTRLTKAAIEAFRGDAIGAAAARLISGDHLLHETLERELAEFKKAEAALLFGSGYLANVGTIPALVGRRDVIYADALNHASLIDACKLSRAELRTFPHLDLATLAESLDADRGKFRRRLIVVDGVFSMDGDLFPLCELTNIAQAYDAWTYVDDAHGTGVLGENGRGSAEHWKVEGQIDVVMGTLGKAFGVAGAYVTGSRVLIDYLLHRARSFVFTTAQPPALAAAASAALRIIQDEPELRVRLRRNATRVRSALRASGPSDGHIVPVVIGESDETVRIGTALRERGILVGAVRPPTVPLGTSRLRITISAAHTDDDIDRLLETLREVVPGS
ncbi:MAG TPA: 8-amino-7-oxononanoate synthase [Gemmatimonadaceae bacterium]|nr:8-amino-7-oxononanoate synthase [Gemmatimonadaceae bacterium]